MSKFRGIVSNLYGSRQSRDTPTGMPLRVILKGVSNLYGSRQSRDSGIHRDLLRLPRKFPIYMDPDRVGTPFRYLLVMEDECMFPIYMDPDRVGTPPLWLKQSQTNPGFQFIWIPTESGHFGDLTMPTRPVVSNLYGSRQSRDC